MNFEWFGKTLAETPSQSSLEITVYRSAYACNIGIGFYWHSNKKTNETHIMNSTCLHPIDGACTKIKTGSETFDLEFAQLFSVK